jgi:hypothetical protein
LSVVEVESLDDDDERVVDGANCDKDGYASALSCALVLTEASVSMDGLLLLLVNAVA